jgi:hypothetical protein
MQGSNRPRFCIYLYLPRRCHCSWAEGYRIGVATRREFELGNRDLRWLDLLDLCGLVGEARNDRWQIKLGLSGK